MRMSITDMRISVQSELEIDATIIITTSHGYLGRHGVINVGAKLIDNTGYLAGTNIEDVVRTHGNMPARRNLFLSVQEYAALADGY